VLGILRKRTSQGKAVAREGRLPMVDIRQLRLREDEAIADAMKCIDRAALGIALVLDDRDHLLATITDGDIRRAILGGVPVDAPLSQLLAFKHKSNPAPPATAPVGTPPAQLLQEMEGRGVRQLPLLDEGRVVDLALYDRLAPAKAMPIRAVIMAGGLGKRLHPLTAHTPKPMLPIGNRPLMEVMVDQIRGAGIRQVHVTTHYLPEQITRHFGDGSQFGVAISYLHEHQPLGTAGALSLLPVPEEPLLVMNGDILTRIDFRAMYAFHREQGGLLTVAVRQYDMNVPYGVIECSGVRVTRIREKPSHRFLVNSGVYLLEPAVVPLIPAGCRFDMTDLIQVLLNQGKTVVSFPVMEYWLDVGQPEDYRRAQQDVVDHFSAPRPDSAAA
jgi:dTDP-glucose pyrophosphorylase